MLIGICGGICAGKKTVRDFLVNEGFTPLSITRSTSSQSVNGDTNKEDRSFATAAELLDYATSQWQSHFVTTSIHSEAVLDTLSHRPFFILINIDAPISVRWKRFRDQCVASSIPPLSLEDFVLRNDAHLYGPSEPSTDASHTPCTLASLSSRAQIKLVNPSTSIPALHASLRALNLTDPSRLRPTWDHYFMTLANLAARRSNCMRRQVGCVLVRENRILSTGYNGTPRNVTNCNEGGCPRCNNAASHGGGGAALSTCLCIHAEENALLEAGRERINNTTNRENGTVLYCNTCPCLTCSIKIVQVGIAEVVFSQSYYMDAEAAAIFKQAGVKLRQFKPVREGVVEVGVSDGPVKENGVP